jgi:Putative peptidoglycan binding domain
LIAKGLLQNRVTKYGSNADGQFGPNTRMAIRAYQKAVDAPATGFLNADQRMALLDDPQERERLASQEAARKRQEEYEAKRQADEQVRQIAAAQAKAKQEAIEKAKKEAEQEARREAEQRAKQEVEDRERKRLEEEAKKATEWRLKIDEAQAKGADYLKRVDTEWSLDEKINPMTDDPDYTVTSIQQNEFGALAQVEGVCSGQQVVFEATLHDAKDRGVPLGLPRSTAAGIIGNKRINDYMVFPTSFPVGRWSNKIIISRQSFSRDDPEATDTTRRVLAEVETSKGTLYIKVPMLDEQIQKLVVACKRRHEIEKKRLR